MIKRKQYNKFYNWFSQIMSAKGINPDEWSDYEEEYKWSFIEEILKELKEDIKKNQLTNLENFLHFQNFIWETVGEFRNKRSKIIDDIEYELFEGEEDPNWALLEEFELM